MSIKDDFIGLLKDGSLLNRLIVINLAFFIVEKLVQVFLSLANANGVWDNVLALSGTVENFLWEPWTLLTFMFLHVDLLHLVFNMLVLYWFGKLFLLFFTQKDLVGLYLLGGFFGGLFFITVTNIFYDYYFEDGNVEIRLIGASASVMAIVVATAVREPEYRLRLLLFGEVKLAWIAIAYIVLSLLNITSHNGAGELSHLGGALGGLAFAYFYKKGTNIVGWVGKILDGFSNLLNGSWRGNSSMKVTYNDVRKQTDYEYNANKKAHAENVDRILEKIKQSGYDSLTDEERKELFKR